MNKINIKKRQYFKKFEIKFLFLKSFSRNNKICKKNRWLAQIKINKLNRKLKINGIKNYCFFSNRNKGLITHLKISRIIFRNIVLNGFLPGFKKAVW